MMNTDTLYLSNQSVDPNQEAFTVMDESQMKFKGETGWFVIIGSSHYIELPEYNFSELFSYDPQLHPETAREVPLEKGFVDNRECIHTTDSEEYVVSTHIEVQPLSDFPESSSFDLSYKFDPHAYTTIELSQDSYETYHTYPEYDIAVYTQTTVQKTESE